MLSVNRSSVERLGYTVEKLIGTVLDVPEEALAVVVFGWFEASLLPGHHPRHGGRAWSHPPIEGGDKA